MKVYINNQTFEFKNKPNNMKSISKTIQKHLNKEQLYINYYLVNGEIIYNDFNHYIIKNMKKIQEIEVVTHTLSKLIAEILQSTDDYITKAIPSIYQYKKSLSHESEKTELMDLVEALNWIFETYTKIDTLLPKEHTLTRYGKWKLYGELISNLEITLVNLKVSILSKDNATITVVLENEIIPLFMSMKVLLRYLRNYMMICL